MSTSPAAILYDASSNPVGVVLDGVVYRLQVQATIAGTLPLPTGAATEATLAAQAADVALIEGKVATQTTLAALEAKAATETTLASIDTKVATQTTLAALEAKAATETTLASIDAKVATEATLAALETKAATEATLASIDGKVATQTTLAALESKAATETTLQTLATEATAQTLLTESEFQARVGTLGQKTMAGSTPVVLASDQSRVLVEAMIADASGTPASLLSRGGIVYQAVDSPATIELLTHMLEQLKAIRLHLELITEEGVEDDHH